MSNDVSLWLQAKMAAVSEPYVGPTAVWSIEHSVLASSRTFLKVTEF